MLVYPETGFPCIRAPVRMIQSFGDNATEALFHGQLNARVRRLPPALRAIALRKLDMLNAATCLRELRCPPGNRLETLRGGLAGFHSIRVNAQWRIVFEWTEAGPTRVSLTDYH